MAARCRTGLKTQSVLLSKSAFPTRASAQDWLRTHGYRTGIDEKPDTWRARQHDPSHFTSFRTISFGHGVKAVVGCMGANYMRYNPDGHPSVTAALAVGAGLAVALGGYLIAKASAGPTAAPEPPIPHFGLEQPEIMHAVGPYGLVPLQNV